MQKIQIFWFVVFSVNVSCSSILLIKKSIKFFRFLLYLKSVATLTWLAHLTLKYNLLVTWHDTVFPALSRLTEEILCQIKMN